MAENRSRRTTAVSYQYPMLPERWNQEERNFYIGIRRLFDQLFSKNGTYPVGIVVFTAEDRKPFTFGQWEKVTTGITGLYAWKRLA